MERKDIIDKCTDKKKKNSKFTEFIAPLKREKSLQRLIECGDFLMFLADSSLENKKLHKGSFCGNRFCPMCSWRKACKDSLEISILMEHLRLEEAKEFIFLTLTTPNVQADSLEIEIKRFNKAFKKLFERKEVKQIAKGYIRKLEVTYAKHEFITEELYEKKKDYYDKRNLKTGDKEPNYNTYNPHFHVVVAVNKSYFSDKKYYISKERWLELWQEATDDKSITQVDVKKATLKNQGQMYELAKYSAKDSDYLHSQEVFKVFYEALRGKQVLVFSGLFKEAHKLYEKGELDSYKQKDEIIYVYKLYYSWFQENYENTRLIELTAEEKEKYNNKLKQDIEID